jgi:hypothetical protein
MHRIMKQNERRAIRDAKRVFVAFSTRDDAVYVPITKVAARATLAQHPDLCVMWDEETSDAFIEEPES